MDAKAGDPRASVRGCDYTPHEHEELRALAKKTRERLDRPTTANRPNGISKLKPA